jgi:hypothetical protein
MRAVRRRVVRYGDLMCCHCGHEELVNKALDCERELLGYVRDELEAMERAIPAPSTAVRNVLMSYGKDGVK